MGKCYHCNVEILDEADSCPLCRCVLEPSGPLEDMYPNARVRMRRLLLISRIYLFCAFLVQAILVGVNVVTDSEIWWSVITGLGLLYVYMILRYAVIGTSGHKSKILVLVLIALFLAVAIDFVTGYRGWSLDFVIPSGIILTDLLILLCMIVNRRNWQSYIMWQLFMILCSFVPAAFHITGLERYAHLAWLPLAVSAALFLGTMLIGDRRAHAELKRRFHF